MQIMFWLSSSILILCFLTSSWADIIGLSTLSHRSPDGDLLTSDAKNGCTDESLRSQNAMSLSRSTLASSRLIYFASCCSCMKDTDGLSISISLFFAISREYSFWLV